MSSKRHENRMRCAKTFSRRSGFTMLELLVVAMLGTIVVAFVASTWRWYARSVNQLHVESQLDQELKFAVTALAQDMGGSIATRTLDGNAIQFDIDDGDAAAQWAAPDSIVQY